jgi:protein O-GlcNAc transferase
MVADAFIPMILPPMDPSTRVTEALRQAIAAHQSGQLAQADRQYAAVLTLDERNFDALHLLGLVRWQQGRNDEAARLIGEALRVDPGSAEACSNLGIVLEALGRSEEALAMYDRALALNPNYAKALCNRGDAMRTLGRFEDALKSYDCAIAIAPQLVEAQMNRGVTLRVLGRAEQALACYDRILAARPNFPEAHFNRGNALQALERHGEALASYDRAVAIRPDYADAWSNRANTLHQLLRYDEAVASCDRALAIDPNHAEAWSNRGNVLEFLHRLDDALACQERALSLRPTLAQAHFSRGSVLRALGHPAKALESFDAAMALRPDSASYRFNRDVLRLETCDWAGAEEFAQRLRELVIAGEGGVQPFTCISYLPDPAIQLHCARNFAKQMKLDRPVAVRGAIEASAKIKIAYLSGDFREHAVARTIAELLELHERGRFEVIGVSFGPDDGSAMRTRLMRSFDQFHDVRAQSDADAAALLAALKVHIVIDLMGYTIHGRPGILARRPAPIQVNYLGYPGTMGADFVDYVLADRYVLPFEDQPFYDEKIVHLPDCYQPNDSKRRMSAAVPSRRDAGLPEDAFVFCCFNNNYKMTAPVFDVWMRLLRSVEPSVLWLFARYELTKSNLRREAAARGIDATRLVFLDELPHDEYLARHALADLFLDTLPYSAHATGSNALWSGLPLLTCRGNTLAGRVGSSLLHAAGLPELVTDSLEQYEALALKLASDRELLQSIRGKLQENRNTCPLFDTDRLRRNLEAAYSRMWDIHRAGEDPRSFAVLPKP